jgi:hypothetical protein
MAMDPPVFFMLAHEFPPDPGGTAWRMDWRARHMARHGFQVEIFAPGGNDHTRQLSKNVVLHRIAARGVSAASDLDYRKREGGQAGSFKSTLRPLKGYLRWLRPLKKALRRRLEGREVVLYTYNNPVTLHLAGLALRRYTKYWVAEFRDPIRGYEYSQRGFLGTLTDGWLEHRVLRRADTICLRRGIQARANSFAGQAHRVVELPDYGVDLDQFKSITPVSFDERVLKGVFAGTVFSGFSLEALDLGLGLYREKFGEADLQVFGPAHEQHKSLQYAEYSGYQAFESVIRGYDAAAFSVLFDPSHDPASSDSGFFPSKLAELIAVQRPVLFIGNPDSVAAKKIRGYQYGVCVANEAGAIAIGMHQIQTGLKQNAFDLILSDQRRKQVDIRSCEQAFLTMVDELVGRT